MEQIDERQIIALIARDRMEIPLSSMYQKIKRQKKKEAVGLAGILGVDNRFETERVYAFVEDEDKMKARGMKEAIAEFQVQYPEYGEILTGLIEEKRMQSERHLYFGVHKGARLTTNDYVDAIKSVGLSEQVARNLYPDLLNVSNKLAKAREEKRSILVGNANIEED